MRFAPDSALCGTRNDTTADYTIGTWSDVTQYVYMYGAYAGSDVASDRFAFYTHQDKLGDDVMTVCCTQNGCRAEEKSGAELFSNPSRGINTLSRANFCRVTAGLTSTPCVSDGSAVANTSPCIGAED